MPFCCDKDGHNDADKNENVEKMRCPLLSMSWLQEWIEGTCWSVRLISTLVATRDRLREHLYLSLVALPL